MEIEAMFSRRWTNHMNAALLAFSLAACGASGVPATNNGQSGDATTVGQTEVPSAPTEVTTPVVAEPTVAQPETTGGQTAEDIAKHREQWAAQNVTNYRYTITRSCMCVETARGPVVVEVKGDQATVTNEVTGEPGGEFFADVDSITKIYALLEQQAKDGADEIAVTYDETNGVPLTIKVDVDFQMADEELYYTISDFETIQ
jgi:hypothetical protein